MRSARREPGGEQREGEQARVPAWRAAVVGVAAAGGDRWAGRAKAAACTAASRPAAEALRATPTPS